MKRTLARIMLIMAAVSAEGRTWTSRRGSTIEADFVKVQGQMVHLRRSDNGTIMAIARNQLSEADGDFLTYAVLNFPEIRSQVVEEIARLDRETYQSRSDRDTAAELLRIYKEWLDAYEKNPDDPVPSYKKCTTRVREVLQRKPIVAYTYNELLKSETEVPVRFSLFTDSDNFYFKVGDGDFSTIAPVSMENLLELQNAIAKIQEWKETCRTERMDTRKEAGRFGGIGLEFVSKDKGENIYVWMTAKGPWAKDRMIEDQTVRLTPLNISAMLSHIGRAKELYDAREQERKNAAKLK